MFADVRTGTQKRRRCRRAKYAEYFEPDPIQVIVLLTSKTGAPLLNVTEFAVRSKAGCPFAHQRPIFNGPSSLRVFSLFAFTSRAQGSSGAVATVPFVWRSHAKAPTTRAGRALDIALRLE